MRIRRFSAISVALTVAMLHGSASGQETVPRSVRSLDPEIHAVFNGGYWSNEGTEGIFRTVVTAGGMEHVRQALYVQWLQIDSKTQSYNVIKTVGFKQINDTSGGYVLDVNAAYPEFESLRLTVEARSARDPGAIFVITAKADGSSAISGPN